jgi:acyl carrier protein
MDNKTEPFNQAGAIHADLHHQVVSIFSDILQVDVDPLIGDISRKELDAWDSINHLRFVLELEEVFRVSLSDQEVSELTSLREVEALLVRYGVCALRADK